MFYLFRKTNNGFFHYLDTIKVVQLYIYLEETNFFSLFADQIGQINYYPISVYLKSKKTLFYGQNVLQLVSPAVRSSAMNLPLFIQYLLSLPLWVGVWCRVLVLWCSSWCLF